MSDKDFKKIGDEIVRALTPVYEWQERADKKFKIIGQKIDALTGDVIQLQVETGVLKDKITAIDEKLTSHSVSN